MLQCCSQVVTQLPQVVNPAVIAVVLAALAGVLTLGKKTSKK